MEDSKLYAIAVKIRPELAQMSASQQAGRTLDILGILWGLPLAALGTLWLIFSTDFMLVRQEWLTLLLFLGIFLLFDHYSFTMHLVVGKGALATTGGSFIKLLYWSAALILGPTGLWPTIIGTMIGGAYALYREGDRNTRWNFWMNIVHAIAHYALGGLVGLQVYRWLGGGFPFPDLTWSVIWPALVSTVVVALFPVLISLPLMVVLSQFFTKAMPEQRASPRQFFLFFMLMDSLTDLIYPFAILAAGLYALHGVGIYLFFIVGALLTNILAYQLSRAIKNSQQRSRELGALEELGRAIIDSPPDVALLPDLLAEHIPAMLPQTAIAIWFLPDEILYRWSGTLPQLAEAQQILLESDESFYRLHKVMTSDQQNKRLLTSEGVVVPVRKEDGELLGGIYVLRRTQVGDVEDFVPALQSLAAQIASVVHRAQVYEQMVASEKMARELEIAGQIQASFLPRSVPDIPDWDMAAVLEPARQTSGDFYDFMELDNGRLGILVADVADKGTGAALYMALSRTLIRTYALQYPDAPGEALRLANERILADTESDQFVTVFYGIIDPAQGTLTYANAGHNPAFLVGEKGAEPQVLGKTGIPLGMFGGMEWEQRLLMIEPGDVLAMYTDGVTEAQNVAQAEFGEARLLVALKGRTAGEMGTAVLDAIHDFVGDAPQFDDVTLVIAVRQ